MYKMKNYNLAAWLVLLLTFVVLFFLIIDTEKDKAAWVSFIFVLLSFGMFPLVYLLRNSVKGTQVLSYTLYSTYYTYFISEIVASLLFLLVFPGHITISIATQLIILSAFICKLLVHKGANVATTESFKEQKRDGSILHDWNSKMELLKVGCKNPEIQQLLHRISDLVISMPIGDITLTENIDLDISKIITDMLDAEQNDDLTLTKELCDELTNKLEYRKLIAKSRNHEYT